jgi:hypothetical protein
LLSVAGIHCPGLVYPLLERGASLREFGPDRVLPVRMDPAVFEDARWKLLRTLYLLHERGCIAIPMQLVQVIGTFLAEPGGLKASASVWSTEGFSLGFAIEPLGLNDLPVPPLTALQPIPPLPLPLFPA